MSSQGELTEHDKIIKALVSIFSAYGFNVEYNIKGHPYRIQGDSGATYRPDIVATRGITSVVCDVRTRGQRGTQPKTDRGAVQLLQAELEDLNARLKRPIGLIVNPNGILEKAKRIAEHYGIIPLEIDMDTVSKILSLNIETDRSAIITEARRIGIVF